MNIKHGTSRIVIIIDRWGFVIKLPKFYISGTLKEVWQDLKDEGIITILKDELIDYSYRSEYSIKWRFFKGLIDNWLEYSFYRCHKLPICQPTWFSLLGWFNIQAAGQELPKEIRLSDVYYQMGKITEEALKVGPHTFFNPKNYIITRSGIKIIDYADPRSQKVLLKHGDRMQSEFDVDWRFKKE